MTTARSHERHVTVNGVRLRYLDWGTAGKTPLICLHGHTHLPTVFRATENENKGIEVTLTIPSHGDVTTLYPNDRYLCNPGSVGQPRDGDPRASFGVLDYTDQESEATFTLYRTEYDIEKAKKETHRVGLPSDLAERLEAGL